MFSTSPKRCVSFLTSDSDLAQRALDYHGKTTRYRPAVHHGRGPGVHGSDARISGRQYGSCPFTPVVKAKQDDEPQWGLDT